MNRLAAWVPLLAGLMLATVAAAPSRGAEGDEPSEPLRFRRVLAPEGRMKDWPVGGEKYLPLDAAEFDRLLAIANRSEATGREAAAAGIATAHYEARLDGDQLVAGHAAVEVLLLGQSPAFLPFEPCNLAIDKPRWITSNGQPAEGKESADTQAVLGLAADGKMQLQVERSGELRFNWSLAGRRDAADIVSFSLDLPHCPSNQLILYLPDGVTLESESGLIVGSEPAEKGVRRWQIELGGSRRVRLRLLPAGMVSPRPPLRLLRESRVYDLSPRGVEVSAQWRVESHNEPLDRVTLLLDPGLQLATARYGDVPLSWKLTAGRAGEATQVVLTLPEPVRDAERVLRVGALAPLVLDRPWQLPRIRAEGLTWQEGEITVLAPEPLMVNRLSPVDCAQTGTGPLSEPRVGETMQFQCFGADATVEVLLARRAVNVQMTSGTDVEFGSEEIGSRVAADFSLTEGARLTLEGRVARPWIIDSIESEPAAAIADWALEPEADGSRLSVQLTKPVSPSRPVRLIVSARRLRNSPAQKISLAELVPVRFADVTKRRCLVSLHAAGNFDLKMSDAGDIKQIDPTSLAAAEASLFASPPKELLLACDPQAKEPEFWLVGHKPKDSAVIRDVAAGNAAAVSALGVSPSATPCVWAWDCRLDSWYESDGAARHTATYLLQTAGCGRVRLWLPSDVSPKDIRGVWVDGARAAWREERQEERVGLAVDFSPGRMPTRVSVEWTASEGPLWIAGRLSPPLPEADLPVLASHWTVWLPPGYESYPPDSPAAQATWSCRLFGPLGRGSDALRFNPLSWQDWLNPLGEVAASSTPSPELDADSNDNAAENQGWNVCRMAITTPAATLDYANGDAMRLLGMVAFLAAAAAACWKVADRPVLMLLLLGLCGAAALVLPRLLASIASSGGLGLIVGLALHWAWRRNGTALPANGPPDRRDHKPASDTTVTAAVRLGAVLLAVVTALTTCGAARGEEPTNRKPESQRDAEVPHGSNGKAQPAAPPREEQAPPIYRVFIPTDAEKKPVGDKVYLPEPFYRELHRRGAAGVERRQGWLILSAAYYGVLSREGASDRLAVESLKIEFDLQTFNRDTKVRIPLGAEGANLLPNGATLDGRAIQLEWEPNAGGLAFEVAEPGRCRLTLSLRPTMRNSGGPAGFDLNIPRLSVSRLELLLPEDAPAVEVPSACGAVDRGAKPPRVLADLGPTDRLSVRWAEAGTSSVATPTVDVEQLLWFKVLPGSVVLDAKFKLRVVEGQLQQLQLVADPRLRLLPLSGDDPPTIEVRQGRRQTRLITLRWPRPLPEESTIEARFLMTETSGVGNFRLPQLDVAELRPTKRWLAVTVNPALDREEQYQEGLKASTIADFLKAWGTADAKPQSAYLRTADDTDWNLATRPHEPRTTADESLTLSFGTDEVRLSFEAQLSTTAGYVFQYRIVAPPGLKVERVSVLEDDVERAGRWSQDADGTLTLFLTGPVSGRQKLSVRGWLPLASGDDWPVPSMCVRGCKVHSATVQLYRRPAVLLTWRARDKSASAESISPLKKGTGSEPTSENTAKDNGREVPVPFLQRAAKTADADQVELGRLAQSFVLADPRSPDITVTATSNRPTIRGDQVLSLQEAGRAWKAQVNCQLDVTGGVVDEFRLRAPASWSGPYDAKPSGTVTVLDVPGVDRQLVFRPPSAVSGRFEFSISGAIEAGRGERPSAPDVLLQQATDLRRWLILPAESPDQPLEWQTSGLRLAEMSESFPAAAAKDSRVYAVVGDPVQAVLQTPGKQLNAALVRLADISLAWLTDGTCQGVAAFDLELGGMSECPLRMPEDFVLVQALIDGAPAAVRRVNDHEWRLPLASERRAQRVEVVFRGRTADADRPGPRTFSAPALGDLPVRQTRWTVAGPASFVPGPPDEGEAIGSWKAVEKDAGDRWLANLDDSQTPMRCRFDGKADTVTLDYRWVEGDRLLPRWLAAAGLMVLASVLAVGWRRGVVPRLLQRRPHTALAAMGFAWWLWLWPSALGLAVVLGSGLAAAWRYLRPPRC